MYVLNCSRERNVLGSYKGEANVLHIRSKHSQTFQDWYDQDDPDGNHHQAFRQPLHINLDAFARNGTNCNYDYLAVAFEGNVPEVSSTLPG